MLHLFLLVLVGPTHGLDLLCPTTTRGGVEAVDGSATLGVVEQQRADT